MTNKEAIELLRPLAERRLNVRVGGDVFRTKPDDIDRALALAIEALERDRWISVKDATPKMVGEEGYTGYLVYSDGFVRVADYVSDGYGIGEFYVDGEYDPYVTHYRPLPEPPKEET